MLFQLVFCVFFVKLPRVQPFRLENEGPIWLQVQPYQDELPRPTVVSIDKRGSADKQGLKHRSSSSERKTQEPKASKIKLVHLTNNQRKVRQYAAKHRETQQVSELQEAELHYTQLERARVTHTHTQEIKDRASGSELENLTETLLPKGSMKSSRTASLIHIANDSTNFEKKHHSSKDVSSIKTKDSIINKKNKRQSLQSHKRESKRDSKVKRAMDLNELRAKSASRKAAQGGPVGGTQMKGKSTKLQKGRSSGEKLELVPESHHIHVRLRDNDKKSKDKTPKSPQGTLGRTRGYEVNNLKLKYQKRALVLIILVQVAFLTCCGCGIVCETCNKKKS